mmetsp:Transcript_64739/g.173624  ORF Transcript_64739/g.173624 Transcript_64739/m.173624 type:complete len:591 (+) Transcript_64739:1061-2833(+)
MQHDEDAIALALRNAADYWMGRRPARPVDRDENWKCRRCPYVGRCAAASSWRVAGSVPPGTTPPTTPSVSDAIRAVIDFSRRLSSARGAIDAYPRGEHAAETGSTARPHASGVETEVMASGALVELGRRDDNSTAVKGVLGVEGATLEIWGSASRRRVVHRLCERLGLAHSSVGEGAARRVVVSRSRPDPAAAAAAIDVDAFVSPSVAPQLAEAGTNTSPSIRPSGCRTLGTSPTHQAAHCDPSAPPLPAPHRPARLRDASSPCSCNSLQYRARAGNRRARGLPCKVRARHCSAPPACVRAALSLELRESAAVSKLGTGIRVQTQEGIAENTNRSDEVGVNVMESSLAESGAGQSQGRGSEAETIGDADARPGGDDVRKASRETREKRKRGWPVIGRGPDENGEVRVGNEVGVTSSGVDVTSASALLGEGSVVDSVDTVEIEERGDRERVAHVWGNSLDMMANLTNEEEVPDPVVAEALAEAQRAVRDFATGSEGAKLPSSWPEGKVGGGAGYDDILGELERLNSCAFRAGRTVRRGLLLRSVTAGLLCRFEVPTHCDQRVVEDASGGGMPGKLAPTRRFDTFTCPPAAR